MYLKVSIEGLGETVYIVTEDHNFKDKGKRGYIGEVGWGIDCFCKNKQEAVSLAEDLVSSYNARGERG